MRFGKILVAGVVVVMGTGAMATGASAYIICNGEGDCWHSERRDSPPGQTFEVHSDDWYFHQEWGRIAAFARIAKGGAIGTMACGCSSNLRQILAQSAVGASSGLPSRRARSPSPRHIRITISHSRWV